MAGASAGSCVDDALTAMDAALNSVDAADLREHPDPAALLTRLAAITARVEAQLLRSVDVFDSSGAWQDDGAASSAAWMRANLRLAPGAALRTRRTARRMHELPELAGALRAGEISRAHVEVVTNAMRANPARCGTIVAAEPTFARAARELDPAQLARVVARWTHAVDPQGSVAAEVALHDQRHLSVSRTFEGAVAIDGLLAPESGALLIAALDALSTSDFRARSGSHADGGDDTSPGQRRADALVELARRSLDTNATGEVVASVRPHLHLTIPLDSLAASRDAEGHEPGELEGDGPLSGEASRRVACDASVVPIGLNPFGVPTALGRAARVVPPSLRRLVVTRDRRCRFAGCDRPASWCQVHHIRHWAHGGPTDLGNLVLMCSHHHHAVHERGFSLRGDPGGALRTHRPDGTAVPDRARGPSG